jgi:hypothetical protein
MNLGVPHDIATLFRSMYDVYAALYRVCCLPVIGCDSNKY